jgi:nicotinamidase-related amidase
VAIRSPVRPKCAPVTDERLRALVAPATTAIPNLVFDAVNRSYRVVVPTDAMAAVSLEYGDHVLRHSLGLVATLVTTGELVEAWR